MKKLALFAALALASISLGKGWSQPWTDKLASFESVVASCAKPEPYKLVAMDDFVFDFDFVYPVSAINWWGTVSHPKQLDRVYYIIIRNNRRCIPAWDDRIVWQKCVKVKAELVGDDCQGRPVYKFYSTYAYGELDLNPGHYWIQISEVDKESISPDKPDFWWSGHNPIEKCEALQMDSSGTVTRPLIDPCYGKAVDLAFEIY